MKLHPSITIPRLLKAVSDGRAMVCIRCGRHATGSPDSEHLPCMGCGENFMYGVYRLLELKLPETENRNRDQAMLRRLDHPTGETGR